MKTQIQKHSAFALAVTIVSALYMNAVNGETETGKAGLVDTNRAYIYPVHGAPNPAPEHRVENPKIVYVNMAYGPAIHSYASNTPEQTTDFNVRYVDAAYGPAIYSYPSHSVKHRLYLSEGEQNFEPNTNHAKID